jgi:hypothetical protein
MVKSGVEYIEKDVEAADTGEEEEEREPMAWELATLMKLSVPIACTVFVLLFLNSVLGRIAIENLYYPLTVVATLLFLLSTVYVSEILDLYRNYTQQSVSAKSNLKRLIDEWRMSIALLIVGVVYLFLIPILGFFVTSFLAMPVIMYIGRYRDWRVMVATTVGILTLIYVLFVVLANLPAPEGMLGI